jgi:hypothetical protein
MVSRRKGVADIQPIPSKGLGVHPARVCPSHNGDINMTTQQNNDATTTNELDQETIDEIRRIVRKHIVATMISVEEDGNWVIDMVTEGDA